MVGQRIREERLRLGLSQRQLAGREMTRHFISLIETGRASPSARTLRIIAARLGKPVAYFVSATADQETESLDQLRVARQLAETGDAAQAAAMLELIVQQALPPAALVEARLELIRCLVRMGQSERVAAECPLVVPDLLAAHDLRGLVEVFMHWGTAAYRRDDFVPARQAYAQAARYSAEHKKMQAQHTDAVTYLGTTLLCMGDLEEATAAYLQAYSECIDMGDAGRQGLVAMGLGKAWMRRGDAGEALRWTLRAVEVLEQSHHPDLVLALHNLAVLRAEQGKFEAAYAAYCLCLDTYTERGATEPAVSILEEMAGYWLQRGDPDRARACCRQALELLGAQGRGILRGRIYRILGQIAQHEGRRDEAFFFLDGSHSLLLRLKAANEADASLEALRRL